MTLEYIPFKTYKGTTIMVHPFMLNACQQLALLVMEGDDDALIIVGGKEGSGKTVHMYQLGHILATLTKTVINADSVHFDANAYMDWAEGKPPGTVGIFDEARRTLNKVRTVGQSQQDFIDWVSQSRDLNHIMIIGLPHPDDLVGYVTGERLEGRGFILQQLKEFQTVERYGKTLQLPSRGHYYFYSADIYLKWKHANPKMKYHFPTNQYVKFDGYNGLETGFSKKELADLKKKKKYYRNQTRMERQRIPYKHFHMLAKTLIETYSLKRTDVCKICDMQLPMFSQRYNAFEEFKEDEKEYD